MDIPLKSLLRFALIAVTVSTIILWPTTTGEETILDEPETVHAEVISGDESEVKTPEVKQLPAVSYSPVTLKKIAWCESRNRQFNPDGTVLRGVVNAQDVGKHQINEKYHLADSIKLGFDIHTLEGNTAYAEYLYSKQGSTPWNWSAHCWSDPNREWSEKGGEYWSK
jgi:hypothetical protein